MLQLYQVNELLNQGSDMKVQSCNDQFMLFIFTAFLVRLQLIGSFYWLKSTLLYKLCSYPLSQCHNLSCSYSELVQVFFSTKKNKILLTDIL